MQWDTVMNVPVVMGKLLTSCQQGEGLLGLKGAPMAVTVAWKSNPSRPSFMQLCPWFLKDFASAKYKTLNDISDWKKFTSASSSLSNRLKNSFNDRAPVDTAKLFDGIILHEASIIALI